MAYTPQNAKLFVLQNCRDSFDSERTLFAARRYENLYPNRIQVVDTIPPGPAYQTILRLIESDLLTGYAFVCKVDDDAFPISEGWLDTLRLTYEEHERTGRKKLDMLVHSSTTIAGDFRKRSRPLG